MTREELEASAHSLYQRNAPVAPLWEQLGETTKGVWREIAADPAAEARAMTLRVRHAVQANLSELARRKENRE